MARISLYNIIFGFAVIFFAAIYGALLALDTTDTLVHAPIDMLRWEQTLSRSAHGHTNLFGILHICFGLTFPFSILSVRTKTIQSIFLACGTFAMGPLMILRAKFGLPIGTDYLGGIIGLFLSLTLASLLVHTVGLAMKTFKRTV